MLLGANIADTSFQEWFLRPGSFPGFCPAITGCRGFAAEKPFRGVTRVRAAGAQLEWEKGQGDTDQEERFSSECKVIFKGIFNFFIGPLRALVKGISCLSSRAAGPEDFGCARFWKVYNIINSRSVQSSVTSIP
jgi:hypothetical protein